MKPFYLFFLASMAIVLITWLFDYRLAFMLTGLAVGTLYDPVPWLVGIILGVIVKPTSYLKFVSTCAFISLIGTIIAIAIFVGKDVPMSIYLLKAYICVLLAHLAAYVKFRFVANK